MNTTKYIIKVTYFPKVNKTNPHLYREISGHLGKGGIFLNLSNYTLEDCAKCYGYKNEKSAKRAISHLKNSDHDHNSDGLSDRIERITYEVIAVEC